MTKTMSFAAVHFTVAFSVAYLVSGSALVGGAIAQVVGENAGDLNWEVSAEATKGTQENIRRLTAGEMEFALANAAISAASASTLRTSDLYCRRLSSPRATRFWR